MGKKILISTGGSGGHVLPAICFYEHLQENFELIITTDKRGEKFIKNSIDNYKLIDVPQITKNIIYFPYYFIIFLISIIKSINLFRKNKIDILISTGGYMTLPNCITAILLNKKIFLFEPNMVLGRSNKLVIKYSKKILCYSNNLINFPNIYEKKKFITKPLLRRELLNSKINAKNKFNDPFKILIIGGSQGAEFFDDQISKSLVQLNQEKKISIIQQIANQNKKNYIKKIYEDAKIENKLYSFDLDLYKKYNEVDLAITRSGASTISELVHFSIPFIAIPLPSSKDNHQYYNAKEYYNNNLCWILRQSEYEEHKLKDFVLDIIKNPKNYFEKRNNMVKSNQLSTWKKLNQNILEFISEN